MAHWYQKVRAAEQFIQNVEESLRAACITFDDVCLHPWRTSGGRSEGVSAGFTRNGVDTWCVTIYEHWNTDDICLKFTRYAPPSQVVMEDKHDVPDIQLKVDHIEDAHLIVQLFLLVAFKIEAPNEMYVPVGWNGLGGDKHAVATRASELAMQYAGVFARITGLDKQVAKRLREVND